MARFARYSPIFILLAFMIFSASPVMACSPTEEAMNLTLEDRVNNAPIILVGTVIRGYTRSYGNGYEFIEEVDVEVEHYLRGEGPTIVHISGFGQGPDCLSVIYPDERGIFFVNGDPDTGLNANYTGVHDAVWQANQDTISTVRGITGEYNEPYPLPVTAQIMRFVNQYTIPIIALSLLVIILAFAPFVIRRIRNPRKSKAKRS